MLLCHHHRYHHHHSLVANYPVRMCSCIYVITIVITITTHSLRITQYECVRVFMSSPSLSPLPLIRCGLPSTDVYVRPWRHHHRYHHHHSFVVDYPVRMFSRAAQVHATTILEHHQHHAPLIADSHQSRTELQGNSVSSAVQSSQPASKSCSCFRRISRSEYGEFWTSSLCKSCTQSPTPSNIVRLRSLARRKNAIRRSRIRTW